MPKPLTRKKINEKIRENERMIIDASKSDEIKCEKGIRSER